MEPDPCDLDNNHSLIFHEAGVKDFVTIDKKWPGVMSKLLTDRIPWQDHKKWFTERGSGIKSTLEIQ